MFPECRVFDGRGRLKRIHKSEELCSKSYKIASGGVSDTERRWRKLKTLACVFCNSDFLREKGRGKHCSEKCRNQDHKNKQTAKSKAKLNVIRVCKVDGCGVEFKPDHFLQKRCHAHTHSKKIKNNMEGS